MAAPNSTSLLNLIGPEYKALEGGKTVPFWPDDTWLARAIQNGTEYGGGEGDAESFRIPFEIDGSITTTVSDTYKATTNLQDITIADKLAFKYEWVDQDILFYKREADLANSGTEFKNIMKFRISNAASAFKKKILVGMLQGDGSSTSTLSGFPSIWYGSTYGGATRTTYADRLDCASATTVLNGGNGTKITTAISLDGKTLVQNLIRMIWATSKNGQTVSDIFVDPIAFGEMRAYLGDKYLTNIAGTRDAGSEVSAPGNGKVGLKIEGGATIHCVDARLITAGNCFGIAMQHSAIYSPKNAPFIPDGPYNEVPVSSKNGGAVDIQFQGAGKFVSLFPTANFWFTQFGQG